MRNFRRGILVALAVFGALSPAAAQAAPGDVYVADRGANTLWKLGPGGGEATPLTTFTEPTSPYGVALGPDGYLYVPDEDADVVWRVDRNTGAKTAFATSGFDNPIDVAFDARGRMLVPNFNNDSIVYVDLQTGAASSFAAPAASASNGFNSLAILRDGTVFVSDENDAAVYRFSAPGARTTLAEGGPALENSDGLFLTPDERYLYVGSYSRDSYERFDLRTGARSTLATNGPPYNTAQALDGRLLYPNNDNRDIEYASLEGVFGGTFSADTDLNLPRGIVVEPPLCAGRFPTVVGTPGKDVLRGSAFADVVLAQGGNDTVKGLGGNDIVCGGPGRDMVYGGKGRDKLLGQAGKDKLFGGKGKDKLKGGAGRDVQRP